MDDRVSKMIELYKQSKIEQLKIFNFTTIFVSVFAGAIQIISTATQGAIPNVISFSNNEFSDVIVASIILLLSVLMMLFKNSSKEYRIVLFLMTCAWGWTAFSCLFAGVFVAISFKYVLIIPLIIQQIYMMRASVFLDENT